MKENELPFELLASSDHLAVQSLHFEATLTLIANWSPHDLLLTPLIIIRRKIKPSQLLFSFLRPHDGTDPLFVFNIYFSGNRNCGCSVYYLLHVGLTLVRGCSGPVPWFLCKVHIHTPLQSTLQLKKPLIIVPQFVLSSLHENSHEWSLTEGLSNLQDGVSYSRIQTPCTITCIGPSTAKFRRRTSRSSTVSESAKNPKTGPLHPSISGTEYRN